MKNHLAMPLLLMGCIAALSGCTDEVSQVGSVLGRGEVSISIETLTLSMDGSSKELKDFDSRTATNLLGKLQTEDYGRLECSYVTRLLPTPSIGFPATVTEEDVDSMKVILTVPRGSLAGDSLAPQQVQVYRLNTPLPSDIDNNYDPTGHYDPEPMGQRSYTLSALALPESNFAKDKSIQIRIPLKREFALEVMRKYRTEPETFQWPSTFAEWFPGLYVCHSFGNGCVANVTQTKTVMYYHTTSEKTSVVDGETVTETVVNVDSVCNFVTSPAVLSANRVEYRPSERLQQMAAAGDALVTSPGGYVAEATLPYSELIEKYNSKTTSLSIISDLTLSVPCEKISSEVSLGVPPQMLMVRTSELASFLENQKTPDGVSSFWANYNTTTGEYDFSSLRGLIVDLLERETISDSDLKFTFMPVLISQENVSNSYGVVTGTKITSCTPYMAQPTMGRLLTDQCRFVFTFSQQTLE